MSLSGAGPSRISEIALRPRGRAVKRIPDEWTSSNRRDRSCPNPLSYSVLHVEFGRDSTIGERESGTQWTSDCGGFYLWPDNVTRTITAANVDTARNNARKHSTFIRRKPRSTWTNRSCDLEIIVARGVTKSTEITSVTIARSLSCVGILFLRDFETVINVIVYSGLEVFTSRDNSDWGSAFFLHPADVYDRRSRREYQQVILHDKY